MKLLPNKLHSLSYVIDYVRTSLNEDNGYEIQLLSEAPLLVRLLSRGTYCAFGRTVYVPNLHLELVKSKHEEDNNLATSKLLPFIMLIHDNKSIGISLFLHMLFNVRYQAHYFIYEFLLLKYIEHPFKEVIFVGFLTSRGWPKHYSFEKIEAYIQAIFASNSSN